LSYSYIGVPQQERGFAVGSHGDFREAQIAARG
jgi:hypothetical protein